MSNATSLGAALGATPVFMEPCCEDCAPGGCREGRDPAPRGDEGIGEAGLLRELFSEPEQMLGGGRAIYPRSRTSGSGSYGSENLSACEDWTGEYKDEGYFCAKEEAAGSGGGDADIESDDIRMLQLAYELLNENLEDVQVFFDLHGNGADPGCILTRLSGGDLAFPRTMIYESVDRDVDFNATTAPASRYIQFNWATLKGFSNAYADANSADERRCVVLSLARILLHETGHSCLMSENFCFLMDYHFRRRVAKREGLTATRFCCSHEAPEGGYDEDNYAWFGFKGDVEHDPHWEKLQLDADSDPPALTCAGPGAS